ncbi:hypothetical protein B0H14DRAFT_3462966 [Mycena olivaceomarginata]|nr:hypothetical protein B0H14DRAFT_3462966 [Mycena olivaceomarginata]
MALAPACSPDHELVLPLAPDSPNSQSLAARALEASSKIWALGSSRSVAALLPLLREVRLRGSRSRRVAQHCRLAVAHDGRAGGNFWPPNSSRSARPGLVADLWSTLPPLWALLARRINAALDVPSTLHRHRLDVPPALGLALRLQRRVLASERLVLAAPRPRRSSPRITSSSG